jgi:hypothetical protein
MPKYESGRVILGNLQEHPAVRAWSSLGPGHTEPSAIHVLKEPWEPSALKSVVYRLVGSGRGGSSVVAKRCQAGTVLVERTIYEQVLPFLPNPQLHYYGSVEEPGGEICWLFLEDARGEEYAPHTMAHRLAAGKWLGRMHVMAQGIEGAAALPDRGPDHYLQHMRSAWDVIRDGLANPALGTADRQVLRGILSRYEQLERNWPQLEGLCRRLPSTLVHGDFVGKNIRIEKGSLGLTVWIFDWESAGWGMPVVDLAQAQPGAGRISANPDIHAYWVTIQGRWPAVDLDTVERLSHVGTIFRLLAAIGWVATGLASGPIRRTLSHLLVYESNLSRVIGAAHWTR